MRFLRVSLTVYLAGCAVAATILVCSAVVNGAFQRQHVLREWLILLIVYVIYTALWPIVLVVLVLMYFGIIHGPIEVLNPFL
jgi:hypothetical protein